MFQKDKSSLYSHGKRAKDVPVRKSERKILLQIALHVFCPEALNEDDRTILTDCFINGDLYKRNVKLPDGKSIALYYRSPNNVIHTNRNVAEMSSSCWPYTTSLQCAWLQMEDDNCRNHILQIPSLALLAVLYRPSSSSSSLLLKMSTVHVPSQVSKFLCRGAHLMRAGMGRIHLVGGAAAAETAITSPVVAIVAMGNPQPFAVGLLHSDLLLLCQNPTSGGRFGPGQQGQGVTIVHCYGDDIWKQQLPPKTPQTTTSITATTMTVGSVPDFDAGHFGNTGFWKGQLIVALEGSAADRDDGWMIDENPEPATIDETNPIPLTAPSNENDHNETTNDDELEINDDNDYEGDERKVMMSPDQVLHLATCKALAGLSLKNDLPMKMSIFYSQYVLPNRPEGSTIELKKTKYKKFGIYIQEQMKNGLITVGSDEPNKDPFGMLVAYDRRHPDVKAFAVQVAAEKALSLLSSKDFYRMALIDLYRVPHHLVHKLHLDPLVVKGSQATSEARKNTGLLTLKEVRAIVEDYIVREELIVPAHGGTMIQLDGPLTDALFKTKQPTDASMSSPPPPPPLQLSRKDVMTKWITKMEIGYALVQLPTNDIIRLGIGKHPVVTIEVVRRQSKKFVTKVTGLEAFDINPDAFSNDASHRFACSSSVVTPQPGGLLIEVLFQGNWVNELEALLRSDPTLSSHGGVRGGNYYLPKNAIVVVLRKGVPARQKQQNTNTQRGM